MQNDRTWGGLARETDAASVELRCREDRRARNVTEAQEKRRLCETPRAREARVELRCREDRRARVAASSSTTALPDYDPFIGAPSPIAPSVIVPPPEFGAAPMPPHVADVAYASATLLEELRESSEEDHLALSVLGGISGHRRQEARRQVLWIGCRPRRRGRFEPLARREHVCDDRGVVAS